MKSKKYPIENSQFELLFFLGGEMRKIATETFIRILVSGIMFPVIYTTTPLKSIWEKNAHETNSTRKRKNS